MEVVRLTSKPRLASLFSSFIRELPTAAFLASTLEARSISHDMVADVVRDSTFGQIVNYLSKGRYFPYADQRPDYVVPSRYLKNDSSPKFPRTTSESPTVVTRGAPTLVNDPGICTEIADANKEAFDIHPEHRLDAEKALAAVPEPVKEGEAPYPWLVEFEENDPDRPL